MYYFLTSAELDTWARRTDWMSSGMDIGQLTSWSTARQAQPSKWRTGYYRATYVKAPHEIVGILAAFLGEDMKTGVQAHGIIILCDFTIGGINKSVFRTRHGRIDF